MGLALKGIGSQELDRGSVLTSLDLRVSDRLEVEADILELWPRPLEEGMVLHLGHWMQFLPCRVEGVDDHRIDLSLEKALVHPTGSVALLTHLDGGDLRVVGRAHL